MMLSRRRASLVALAIVGMALAASGVAARTVAARRDEGASPPIEAGLERRATGKNYTNPNLNGGQMKTIIPDLGDLGEPLNIIVSGLSDPSVLTIEGFLLWVTSINFGVSCLGQANGTQQSANLGSGSQLQGTGDGNNGVLRWNYYQPYVGTCKETVDGGNHFRWFKQPGTNAYFLASSIEMDLSTSHMVAQNGYNDGRDQVVGNATFSNGTAWQGNLYNTTVEWIPAGVLLNATSDGINHPSVALPGQPTQDGRVALLTVRQLKSANASNNASMTAIRGISTAHVFVVLAVVAAMSVYTVM